MQRERVCKTLALVMLLLSLATGLCAAKSDNLTLMWEEAIPNSNVYGEKYKYYIDESKTKIMDYNGRKYLQVYWQRNKLFMEQVWFVLTWREAEKAHYTEIFDVGKRKAFILEYLNKDYNPKKGNYDISTIKQNSFDYGDSEQKVMQWISQNRPSLLEEINKANGDTVSVGTQTVTANGDYGFVQTLGNGPVQFVPRMIHDGGTRYYVAGVPANGFLSIQDRICPPTAPDSHKPLYIVYDIDTYPSFSQNTIHAIFSYDDETNTFTLYDKYYDFSRPLRKIRIIDQNTVEGSYWDGETYSENNPLTIQFKYVKALPGDDSDRDGCAWTGWDLENDVPAPISVYFDLDKYVDPFYMNLSYELVYAKDNNEVGLDGLFAFLARKGNVGYAPPVGSRVKYY